MSHAPGDPVHTCHAECPCHTGGEPRQDFIAVEGSLIPALYLAALLRDLDVPGEDGGPR